MSKVKKKLLEIYYAEKKEARRPHTETPKRKEHKGPSVI